MTRRRELDMPLVIDLYANQLLSVQAIAQRLGVSKPTVRARLREVGQHLRGMGEAQRVRAAQSTPEARLANVAAAHAARRGSRNTRRHVLRVAQAQVGKFKSPGERLVFDALAALGAVGKPGFLVGTFLVDIAFPEVRLAVEVDGGNWHSTRRKAEQDARKSRSLAARGWRVLRVTLNQQRGFDVAAEAREILTHLKGLGFPLPP